jgi:hypothetical protein
MSIRIRIRIRNTDNFTVVKQQQVIDLDDKSTWFIFRRETLDARLKFIN